MNVIKEKKKSIDCHFARLQNLIILWSGCNSNSGQLVTNVSGFLKKSANVATSESETSHK